MACNCKSYNLDDPGCGKDEEVILTPPKSLGMEKETICVDACIAHVIRHLWGKGIPTLGCCCGHNKQQPTILLTGPDDFSPSYVRSVIGEADARSFRLQAWQVVDL